MRAVHRTVKVCDEVRERIEALLPESGYLHAAESIARLPGYAATPLVRCPDIARALGVAELRVKNESQRLGLKSFKALGGAYAVREAYTCWREGNQDRSAKDFVVTCVTDGNHGLSVAWGAREVGCRSVIYVPDVVTEHREADIRDLGAEVVRVDGNYDEVTRENAAAAARHGWTIVTDTSVTVTAHPSVVAVMQGYRVLAQEVVEQYGHRPPTHVFLQAGCGGMAGAVIAHLVSRWATDRLPVFVVVEPENAACLLESAQAGEPQTVEGTLETLMAGISVGEVSLAAWEILRNTVPHFIAIEDAVVPPAMRQLAHPATNRPVIVAGETGAAGLGGVLTATARDEHRVQLGVTEASRILVLNTEGDTDPERYAELIGS